MEKALTYLFTVIFSLFILAAMVMGVTGCISGAKVRYDAAPSPIDTNYHTVLMEADCGDGKLKSGFGQMGCSWGDKEEVKGRITIHTPLPGKISLYSRACGIDKTEFHSESGGSFQYDLAELLPQNMPTCVLDVFVSWQLPPNMSSEYPLRGMTGRIYLRRRGTDQTTAGLKFGKDDRKEGVNWAQFREVITTNEESKTSEPLELRLYPSKSVVSGAYRMFGCGLGVQSAALSGEVAVISRDELIGPSPKKSRCVLFGFAVGQDADGGTVNSDAMLGVEVFGINTQKLAVNLSILDNKVCYEAESSVSLAVLHYGNTNHASNNLNECLTLPVGQSKVRIGFFTAQGRAYYALIENNQITEVLQ